MKSTTKVRIAVARFEFTPSIPTFARIEVSAANFNERFADASTLKELTFSCPGKFAVSLAPISNDRIKADKELLAFRSAALSCIL